MSRLPAAALALLAAASAAGCAGAPAKPDGPFAPARPLDLVVAVATSRPSYWGDESDRILAGVVGKTGAFREVTTGTLRAPGEADVVVHLQFGMTNAGVVTARSADGQDLVATETISCGFKGLTAYPDCVGRKVARLVHDALDGNPLHNKLVMARKSRPRPAAPVASASASAPAPAGLSKEDIQKMMAEALKAAAQPAAPVPAAASSDADRPTYRLAPRPDDYAVVVGVEKYNSLPSAAYAERDAKAVYDHLVALGWPPRNIALLTGAEATRGGLVKNLERWLPQNANERSTVFFYYSGHGAPDPAAGDAYLVPADGDPQYLEDTAYPVKRLHEKLGALKARRVLVAMDSCFSGAGGRSVLAKGTRPLVGRLNLGAESARTVSLTASASDQISGTLDEQGHGLFTYHLLRGLNGAAADASGAVTTASLYEYLLPRVRDDAKRANREQIPQLRAADPSPVRLR
ncbi:MAG: caspase family protein [Elusimicrobiota bacterium]|nr:caspase family protein [Elusimicrobiota bacterium]